MLHRSSPRIVANALLLAACIAQIIELSLFTVNGPRDTLSSTKQVSDHSEGRPSLSAQPVSTAPWKGVLANAAPPRPTIEQHLPALPVAAVTPFAMLAGMAPALPAAPRSSLHPVDFGYGQKIETTEDAVVHLRGHDFPITRIYSSKPPSGATESGPGAVGVRWTMNILRAGRVGDDGDAFTVTQSDGTQHTFVRDSETDPWEPQWPTTQTLTNTLITVGASTWAVYRHEEAGQWIVFYYRTPEEADIQHGAEEELPEPSYEGLLLQERDVYNNQCTYAYGMVDFGSTEIPDQPRPVAIYLHPTRDTIADWAAKIELTWHSADDNPAPAAAQVGRL